MPDIAVLPNTTFLENWITIIAVLYQHGIAIENIVQQLKMLEAPQHRLEFVRNYHNVAIYNDSKSTVWQATLQALQKFPNKRIALFLGGLSKGTDRSELITKIKNTPVTIFAFGDCLDLALTLLNIQHLLIVQIQKKIRP